MNISAAVIRASVIIAGCILALLLGTTLTTNSLVPLIFTAGLIMVGVTALIPEWLLLVCIVCSLLPGRTALSVGYWEVFSISLIARWALIVPFQGGLFGRIQGKFTLLCITVPMAVLIMHGMPALLGVGGHYGSRMAIMALASIFLSYLLLSGKTNLSKLPWLPWAGLIPGLILTTFDVVNLTIPALIPLTILLYDNQNWEILANFGGANLSMIRVAGLRELGLGLAFLSLAYFARQNAATMKLFAIQMCGTVTGAALTLVAGYRSFVAQVILGAFLAAYARSKAALILALVFTVLGLSALVFVHHAVMALPLTVQRAISWLPGDWDWQTKNGADDGYQWREEIRSIYFSRIFPDSWLLGRGLAYDERSSSMQWMMTDPDLNTDYFVLMQCYHSGLVSSLDFVGVVGTTFFILGCLRAGWNCLVIFRRRSVAQSWHIWTALMFVTSNPPFWYTGFFNLSFPFFAVTMSLLEIARNQVEAAPHFGNVSSASEADYELEETREGL